MRGISKCSLPVIWKANRKAWITRDIFTEWFTDHFCPSVQHYCRRKGLQEKALLIMDNVLSHPTNLTKLHSYGDPVPTVKHNVAYPAYGPGSDCHVEGLLSPPHIPSAD
ncbi:CENPB DNA-binding domain-containing 1 [Pelobates cultripes]|uniref:CENPB DNA-binding domain-containing 1 n=1 Tax=Pelobates cultripes TaxID=61616 RepID=A0AAD1T2E8_PELCU|nr:CENPB DNA-binding domain-containing 1 [Pelobates cultripes]